MLRTPTRLAALLLLAGASAVRAQVADLGAPADSARDASAPRRTGGIEVRVSGGRASLALGAAGAFHQSVAEAYRAAGVPVPTQRSFDPGPVVGVDVLWEQAPGRRFGVGFRYAASDATSLYGDYAGTLDVVTHVSAVFAETVSTVELGSGGRVRPFLGSRGGTVFASATTREDIDLGELGAVRSTLGGKGVGFSFEGFGGATVRAGPAGLFVQAGYRYARVRALDGESRADGVTLEKGRLPYGLALSGWTGTVGLTLSRR